MRYIRYLFLAIVGLVLLIVALANRGSVTLSVLPEELASFAGWNAEISPPIFAVIFASIVAGLLIGFVWEWMREYKHRAAASHHRRERERLEKEVDRLKTPEPGSGDEVLAILDKAS